MSRGRRLTGQQGTHATPRRSLVRSRKTRCPRSHRARCSLQPPLSFPSVPPFSQPDIRKAYLRLAVQLHPDKNPGDEVRKRGAETLLLSLLSPPLSSHSLNPHSFSLFIHRRRKPSSSLCSASTPSCPTRNGMRWREERESARSQLSHSISSLSSLSPSNLLSLSHHPSFI